ncbi:acyl-CoA reductase-like NAD-dependent aldehyde dehydrogenase [Methanocalculus alkaliphilus]|uniref:aldehyde dehydrogenase family protein n=1 Tax=Methanocalculus alkaliphilus TaxID=768730 RepID=UPI00209E9E81|nr:aldehyde dehydrogenase family protein [Methanocalculus alkaliphilus]MCP1715376.1 acyl-CoA reductase-like NAD-dependent aldehyde dehydrogenase [Methanocalculus alkaliphilus]
MREPRPFCLAGRWKTSTTTTPVINPYTREEVACVCTGSADDLFMAAEYAAAAFRITNELPTYLRRQILHTIAALLEERRSELVDALIAEGGKVRKVADGEVTRAIETITISAEEASRITGTIIPLDRTPGGAGHTGHLIRVPVGPLLAITPFNYPLNLACHKIGPAIAIGAPFLLKPATATPLSSLILAEIILDAGYPPEAVSVIPAPGSVADAIIGDERFAYLSFTGSPEIGWELKKRAGRKKVSLELGGNAAAIICRDADLPYAASRIIAGGFVNAGQNCVSVQRVLIHHEVYEEMTARILSELRTLRIGDPRDPTTDLGPMISEEAAAATEDLIRSSDARIVAGGTREGALLHPTVLADVDPAIPIACREIFAPVILLSPYRTEDEAFSIVNASEYGLQAGIFTDSLETAQRAFSALDVGAVLVNDIPTFRVDEMPYGGVKGSGTGREGPAYAIAEMTVEKMLIINKR